MALILTTFPFTEAREKSTLVTGDQKANGLLTVEFTT